MTDRLTEALDPRVARTRRDVVDVTSALLLEDGWDAVSHAEVARRSGYAKATVYAHWPTRTDLIRDAIDQICDHAENPAATGDLRFDLHASLADFARDLSEGHLDRLLGGVIERAHQGPVIAALRAKLYDTGTRPLRAVLAAHVSADDVDPILALLTGALLVRVTFEAKPATRAFIDDLVDRVLTTSSDA